MNPGAPSYQWTTEVYPGQFGVPMAHNPAKNSAKNHVRTKQSAHRPEYLVVDRTEPRNDLSPASIRGFLRRFCLSFPEEPIRHPISRRWSSRSARADTGILFPEPQCHSVLFSSALLPSTISGTGALAITSPTCRSWVQPHSPERTGCGDLLDFLVMPGTGESKIVPGPRSNPDAGYRSRFDHEDEHVEPGFYSILLKDYGIRADDNGTHWAASVQLPDRHGCSEDWTHHRRS
jgi:hypothetical protein